MKSCGSGLMYPCEENGYCGKWEYMEQFCLFEIFICSASGREAGLCRITALSAVLGFSSPALIGIAYCFCITVHTIMYAFTGWTRESRWGKWNVNSIFCSMLGHKIQSIRMSLFHCPAPWQAALLQTGPEISLGRDQLSQRDESPRHCSPCPRSKGLGDQVLPKDSPEMVPKCKELAVAEKSLARVRRLAELFVLSLILG